MIHAAIRCFNEAELADARISRKVGNQTDVRTFGSLDGTHTAVLSVVNVADLEGGTVTGQTARAESRQTALVRQLGQGVVLVHKLGQRRRTEELLDGGDDGTDVDECLRRDGLVVLNGHTLLDDLVHAGETEAQLILQKFTDTAQTTVAEVVDVVLAADAVGKADEVVDGGVDVLTGDVLLDEVRLSLLERGDDIGLLLISGKDLGENVDAHALTDARGGGVELNDLRQIHGSVGEDVDDLTVVGKDVDGADGSRLEFFDRLGVEDGALFEHDLTGEGADGVEREFITLDALGKREFLVELVAADGRDVVAARVEEHIVEKDLGTFHQRRITGAQTAIDLLESLLVGSGVIGACKLGDPILFDGLDDLVVVTEERTDVLVLGETQSTKQNGDGDLAVAVDLHVEDVVDVRLVFQPRAAIRDHGAGEGELAHLVDVLGKVHARATDDLGDDDALRTVDDERTVVGHLGEVAHVDLLFLDLVRLLVGQTNLNAKRHGVVDVALLAFLHRILGVVLDRVIHEVDEQLARVIHDGRDVLEHLAESLV